MGETRKALHRLRLAWLDYRLAMAESRVVKARIAALRAFIRLADARATGQDKGE